MAYTYDAASTGWNNNWSKYINQLEEEFASFIGVKYAISTSSCTGALHIALASLDIGHGDEVIVPDQTWVATANAVRYVGATPIFADVNIDTWNIDINSAESLLTKKTKAIIPVHMYGNPCDLDEVKNFAKNNSLYMIEDAAPSIGAEWQNKKTGSFGDFAGFSFQGAKLMVTGEGGMLVTDNEDLYKKAKKIADQGRNSEVSRPFWIDGKGLKYKISNIQASFGLGQLRRINTLVSKKRRIFDWYNEFLKDINSIEFQKTLPGAKSIYWMTSIRLKENSILNRDTLIKKLKDDLIDTRPVFPAISQYPIWDNDSLIPKQNAEIIGNNALNLPSGVCLSKEQIQYVCNRIKHHLHK